MSPLKVVVFLAAAFLLVTVVQAKNYKCTKEANFILGLPYSQRSLTDGCKGNVCDANPVYGGKNCPKKALKWCQAECTKQSNPSCVGFFFQKHHNGHEICGFYHGVCPKKTMHAPALRWVQHNHKNGAICEVVPSHKKSSTPFPQPTKDSSTVHLIQGTVQFASALTKTESGQKIFDLAFRTLVAHAAGHVCGAKEVCSPGDVQVTSFHGVSISFKMRVANGQLATAAVANIKAQLEDGSVFAASLAAAGVTDIATLKKMVLGEKSSFKVQAVKEVQEDKHEEDPKSARILRLFRCPKFLAVLGGVVILLILSLALWRYMRAPRHIQLQEVPAAEVVVSVNDKPAKYEIVKDDLSKDQV